MEGKFIPWFAWSYLLLMFISTGTSGQLQKKVINITLTQQWTYTGLTFKKGDPLDISASGILNWYTGSCDGQCVSTPEGTPCSFNGFPTPQFNCWSLIGQIGNGQPFAVGNSLTTTAQDSGLLFLGVNDNNYPDNTGNWQATIDIPGVKNTIAYDFRDPNPAMMNFDGELKTTY